MQKQPFMKKGFAIVVSLIFSIPFIAFMLPAASHNQINYFAGAQLEQKAASEGSVKVIIKLLVPQIDELTSASNSFCSSEPDKESAWGGSQADMALMDSIAYAAQGVLMELRGTAYEVNHIYKSIPYMALQISAEALDILRTSPAVLGIEEDVPQKLVDPVPENGKPEGGAPSAGRDDSNPPLLDTSVNLIGASAAWSMGYTGSGRYVAILDTGIRSTHQFFQGKTIIEACYALGSDGAGPAGDCPNGLISMTGAGSAVHYPSTYSGYDHGTHVSGIATGNNGVLFGVAKDANIIAVKIFSEFPGTYSSCGGTPCVLAWNSDQLAGLDYVYSIRGSYSIASVNMSLGGGSNTAPCDSDSRKAAIDNLRSVGIATAIATGNNGWCGYISTPACISTSVAVGSSDDADARSIFSNWHATMQKLFAPGSSINSSTGASDTSYASWNGTSMATPHVAGAWALVKQAKSSATVTEILSALQSTGVSILTSCGTPTIPRIQVNAAINSLLPQDITLTVPNGGENWNSGTIHNITWSSAGAIANVKIDYSINNGGNWSPVTASTANTGSYSWTVPAVVSAQCLVRIGDAADSSPSDLSDRVFSISSSAAETVSTSSQPAGPVTGQKVTSYSFSTGGSASNLGHSVQYKLDWNDGSDSGWLAAGTTTASHSWTTNGTYNIRAMARCVTHTAIESGWSVTHAIVISDSGSPGYFNSPANRQILPEAIWAPATGGGTWVSEVQVVDMTGGSRVSVYYNTSGGRRGPFTLWDNSGGTAGSSRKYGNMLQTIDGLDAGAFTYDGTVGAVEFATQDGSHLLHVSARTVNGDYAKTFPGLNDVAANTADTSRQMVIPNVTTNATYRSTVGCFNPGADSVTVEFRLVNGSGAQLGSTFSRSFPGYGFQAFYPFTEAGLGSGVYDNASVYIRPISGTGRVMPFGASANNSTNDPAALIAVQAGSGYETSPSNRKILPEVIWAPATGGGTWMSEVQVVDMTGGSQVSVYYNTAAGRQGPFLLWNNSGGTAGSSMKFSNLLQTIDGLDAGAFTYDGTVGAVEFAAQDGSHLVHVAARTLNGDYSKTFPGLNDAAANTADTTRQLVVPNMTSNATYRSTVGCFNPGAGSVTVEFRLLDGTGAQIGSLFTRTFAGFSFQAFFPFTEAGISYPAFSYDNVKLIARPTSGTGKIFLFGASANNASNDPAAHIGVQYF